MTFLKDNIERIFLKIHYFLREFFGIISLLTLGIVS